MHPGHENRGMNATRNLGINNASGEFIAFVDADDVWRRNKLTDQVAILQSRSEVGMVCGTLFTGQAGPTAVTSSYNRAQAGCRYTAARSIARAVPSGKGISPLPFRYSNSCRPCARTGRI